MTRTTSPNTITVIVLSLLACSRSPSLAFIVRPHTTTTTTTTLRNPLVLHASSGKPTHTQIEESGRQKAVSVAGPSSLLTREQIAPHHVCGSVQGMLSKDVTECCKYGCELTQNVELKTKLERLTQPRAYPLFLLEKAAKIVGDSIRRKYPRREAATKLAFNGAVNGTVNGGSSTTTKERLVILGSGWATAALLSDIDNDLYDVTVVSPRNYFLFTPMLAGASVGTVDVRSITQPIREFNRQANYLEAAASSIDTKAQTVTCQGVQCNGDECDIREITVPYDRLVVAVGARTNTFGIPGVEEHCFFLKQVADARQIRRKIVSLFEKANFPDATDEQRRKLLTFAIIGAGPTGVEAASELRDFIEEDGPKYYPQLLKYVKIKVIEASPSILQPFDESLRQVAAKALTRNDVVHNDSAKRSLFPADGVGELLLGKKVEQITADAIHFLDGTKTPYGMAIWAGGIGPLPITLNIIDAIGGRQVEAQKVARGKIAVDPWLRAINANGRIFAAGDCVCTQGQCLPSTAQVAAQEGEFLAHLLSSGNLTAEYEEGLLLPPRRDASRSTIADSIAGLAVENGEYIAPFQFLDMGMLAYTGVGSALAQVQVEKSRIKAQGPVGFGLWRSVYFMKQASMRNRFLVAIDWTKARLFGRDITAID